MANERFKQQESNLPPYAEEFLKMLKFLENPNPEQLEWDEVDGLIVSTVITADEGPETAIRDANNVHPVERYETASQAREGHKRWVQFVQDGNREIVKLGYGSETIVKPTRVTLQPKEN